MMKRRSSLEGFFGEGSGMRLCERRGIEDHLGDIDLKPTALCNFFEHEISLLIAKVHARPRWKGFGRFDADTAHF